jgi:acyl carrier protein
LLLRFEVNRFVADGPRNTGENVDVQVRSELIDFIVANYLFGDVARTPADDYSLVEGGVIDSTGILELIEFLEPQFGIEVSEAETVPENLGTISNLTRFVMNKKVVREPSC